MHWFAKVLIGLFAIYGLYIISAIPQAYLAFKARPREPMEKRND
jgi:hypothetical protein